MADAPLEVELPELSVELVKDPVPEPATDAAEPPSEGVHQDAEPRAVCLAPDVCLTPVGSMLVPVPYQVWGKAEDAQNFSTSVYFRGTPAMRFNSVFSKTYGDEPAQANGGVKSGKRGGKVEPKGHSPTVNIQKSPAMRKGDRVTLNGGNTDGEMVVSRDRSKVAPPQAGAAPADGPRGMGGQFYDHSPTLQDLNAAKDKLSEWWHDPSTIGRDAQAAADWAKSVPGKVAAAPGAVADAAQNAWQWATWDHIKGAPGQVWGWGTGQAEKAWEHGKDVYRKDGAGGLAAAGAGMALEGALFLLPGPGELKLLEDGAKLAKEGSAVLKGAEEAGRLEHGAAEGAEHARPHEPAGKGGDGVRVSEKGESEPSNGPKPCTCAVGNPVRIDTGAALSDDVEFELRGSLDLILSRHYASDETFVGPLGRGIATPIDVSITETPEGTLAYLQSVHRRIRFARPSPFPHIWATNDADRNLALSFADLDTLLLKDDGLFRRFTRQPGGVWRLAAIEDRNGNRITLERDPRGLITRIDHPDGLSLAFDNDAAGRRTGVTLVGTDGTRCELLRYRYDARANLVAAESTCGPSHVYEHDAADRRVAWTDGVTTWSRRVYDAQGRVVRGETHGADGAPAPYDGDSLSYDPENNRTLYTPGRRPEERRWYHYGPGGLVIAEEDALGNRTEQVWSAAGEKLAEVDAEGGRTEYRYDAYGRVASVTDPEGRETRTDHDADGNLQHVLDPLGRSWVYGYDERGNLVSVTDPLGHRTDIAVDAAGRPVALMRHDGLIERRAYDAHGRLSGIRDFRGGLTRFARDGFRRVVAVEDPLGGVTRFAYEPGTAGFWQPSRVTRPDGVVSRLIRDRSGTRVERVDGEGRRTVERTGAYGLHAEIEDPKGGLLRFGHDGLGRLERVENQLGRAWTFERDAAGRVVAETDFDGLRTTYAYDRAGRLTEKLAADGTRTVYAHDASGLLTGETVTVPGAAEPQVTTFAYDGAGQLVAARGGGSEVLLEWDALGRVVAETVDGRRVESRYDCCGNRVERVGLGGRVESRYDPLGVLTALEIAGHGALTLDHDAGGRELRRASAAGFVLESTWDAAGQLVRQVGGRGRSSGSGAGKVLERVYGWDRAYAPVSVSDLRWGGTGYRYDRNGQVVEGRHGDGSAERYGYDAALNVAEFAESDGPAAPGGLIRTASYGRDPAGQLRARRGTAGGRVEAAHGPSGERVTYRHDVCGRVVERVLERDGFRPRVWRYAWDGKDRLVGCTTPSGERWAYGYDAFGRRLWKRRTDAGSDAAAGDAVIGTAYGWDGDLLSAEAPLGRDGSADWARATIWHYEPGTFRPLAREGSDGSLAYVVTDHLGTPRELVDAEGRLLWSAEYRVWGAVRRVWVAANDDGPGVAGPGGGRPGGGRGYAVAGNLALAEDAGAVEAVLLCPLRFQGQWQDGETGLVYNRFRYYDPSTTQYVSPDPMGLIAGVRSSAYVARPTVLVDAYGLVAWAPLGSGYASFRSSHPEVLKRMSSLILSENGTRKLSPKAVG